MRENRSHPWPAAWHALRRLFLAAAALAAASAMIAAASLALFTSAATPARDTLAAGTVVLGATGDRACHIGPLEAGDSSAGYLAPPGGSAGNHALRACDYSVAYTGTLAAWVWLDVYATSTGTPADTPAGSVTQLGGEALLNDGSDSSGLDLQMHDTQKVHENRFTTPTLACQWSRGGSTVGETAPPPAAGSVETCQGGSDHQWVYGTGPHANATDSRAGNAGSVDAGWTDTVAVDYALPLTAGDAFQGSTATVTLTAYAEQASNNPLNLVTDVPGNVIDFGTDPAAGAAAIPQPPATPAGRQLLLSDDPEYVPAAGVLYADTVQGEFRVFAYHAVCWSGAPASSGCPATSPGPLYVDILVHNPGLTPETVDVTRVGRGGPSGDFLLVGRDASANWMAAQRPSTITLGAGETAFLVPAMTAAAVKPEQAINAIVDAASSGPVEVAIVSQSAPVAAIPANVLPSVVLGASGTPQRGTFAASRLDETIATTLTDRPQVLSHLAAPGSYVTGTDALDHVAAVDYGNYGVLYQTSLQVAEPSGGPAGVSVLLNPRGGDWEGAAVGSGGPTALPAGGAFVRPLNYAVVLGDYGLNPNHVTSTVLQWLYGGASNLPVDLLLYPLTGAG